MGEIADSMLGGEMCEGCGVWLMCDACAALGIPAYCSNGCADDRGAPHAQVCRHTPEEKGDGLAELELEDDE